MVPVEPFISLVLVGLGAGIASGLFGIGGGVVSVPALIFLLQSPFRQAVAISLLTIGLTVPVGLWTHHRAGNVRWRLGVLLSLAGILGVVLAHFVDPWLGERGPYWAFAGLLVYAADRVAHAAQPQRRRDGSALVASTGIASGLVSKLFGVGGGVVVVPALVLTGTSVHVAVATSLVAVVANALVGSALNLATLGPPTWAVWALPLGLGSLLGTWIGSRTALRTHSDSLRRGFALLLVLVAISLVHRSLA